MASIVLLPSSPTTIREYACTAAEAVGDCVSLYGDAPVMGLESVRKTDITMPPWRRSIGVVLSKSSSTVCKVLERGVLDGVYSGLDIGREYGVGLTSQLQLSLPTYPISGPQLIMFMGIARSATQIEISPHAVGIRHP